MATQMARFVPPEFIGAGPKRPDPRRTALQDEAVASAVAGYSAGAQRGQIIEPCGVGKTLIAIRIVAALGARTVLVLVPRLDLVSQWGREFYSWYGRPFDPAIFCSDDDIADGASFPRWTTRTTSTAELRGFMASGDPAVTKIVFATYQSSGNLAGSAFDIGVVDEAHNCVGDMSGLFKTVLDDEKIRIARRLFITATQKVVRLRGDTPDDVTWASMDDVVAFGPVFHRTTFGEGIKRGLVNDYEVAIFDVAERQLNRYASEMGIVAEDALKQAGAVLGTLNALRRHKKKRLVAFLNSVQGAKDFAQALTEARLHLGSAHRPPGRFWSGCIHAGTPHAARQQMLAAFDGDDSFVRVISNVDVLGEGVDMQGADAVAIIEPRMSTINIVQALSRGLRVKPRKGKTLFLLSVMRRDGQDASALLDESSFRHVWRVLLAMAEMDERLRGELERFAFKASKEGKAAATAALPARIHLDGDIVGMHVAIRTQIVKRVGFSVGVARPDLMREFHPTKNGALTAFDLTPGMQKKVWWLGVKGGPGRCRHQHEWQAAPASRVAGCGCPFCSGNRVDRNMSVGALNPDLAREFHPTKNGALTAFDVNPGTLKKVWWLGVKDGPGRCKHRHEWQAAVGNRTKGSGCPFCSGNRVERSTSVGGLNPDLAREWHPTKNGALTAFDISPGSGRKVWWRGVKGAPGRCARRHEWQAVVASRTRGMGCPQCKRDRASKRPA